MKSPSEEAQPEGAVETASASPMTWERALQLVKPIGRFFARAPAADDTDLLPLIRHRADKRGHTKALEGKRFDRKMPYVLRGRRNEFNFLAERLVGEPSSIALVAGPPGSGKTSLTSTVAAYARCIGHTVVEIGVRDLANAANIAQACRKAIMTPQDAHVTQSQSSIVNTEVQLGANFIFAEIGTQLNTGLQHQSTRQDVGDINLLEHLEATCQYHGKTHPLLILVDEVQDIEDVLAESPAHRSKIKANLKILNDTAPNKNLPITTILAGLDPVRDTLVTLVSRPARGSDLQLTPIAAEHIRAILQDYLNIDEPQSIPQNFYPQAQMQEWAESCEGHVLFANQLAFELQSFALEQLANGIKAYNHEQHHTPLDKERRRHREEHYDQQLPNSTTDPRKFDVAMHLAHANRMNHAPHDPDHTAPITWQCARDLARSALNTNLEESTTPIGDELPAVMRYLQHKGIIRRMQPLSHFLHLNFDAEPTPVPHCAIPIPTITTKILKELDQADADTFNRVDRNVREALARYKYNPGTEWQWTRVPRRRPIPRLDCDYEEPLARDEPQKS